MCFCNKIPKRRKCHNNKPTGSKSNTTNTHTRKDSTCSSTRSHCIMTSQLPKPVECIEVDIEDHYFVPPVVIDGEVVTSFQYLSLHDIDKYIDNESGAYKKNKKLRDKISQKLNELFVDCVNNNRKENTKCLSLDDLYKETFKVDSVKDLYKNSSNKKYNHTI